MLERELEERICQAVEKVGGMAVKLESPGVRGRSDRLILLPGGNVFFAEIKRPTSRHKTTAHQVKFIQDIRKLGIPAYVISTFKEFADILDAFQQTARLPTGSD